MSRETKDRLLDAAELLFVQHGIRATSLRSITSEAGANLAAVNYHFGSKEELIRSVVDRRLQPLNARRLELLDRLEARGAPSVEEIVDALVRPAFQLAPRSDRGAPPGPHWADLMARLHFEQDEALTNLLISSFKTVHERFFGALHEALPELSERQLLYRLHFAIGAMAMTVANRELMFRISGGVVDADDTERAVDRLVNFVSHGFRAPRSASETEETQLVVEGGS